jgi:ferric-dicitrate binding protein FerR (iron transport regulator)
MADLRSRPTETARRQVRSTWMMIALVAAALLLVALLVPSNDTTPNPETTNTGPSTGQPVQPKAP